MQYSFFVVVVVFVAFIIVLNENLVTLYDASELCYEIDFFIIMTIFRGCIFKKIFT